MWNANSRLLCDKDSQDAVRTLMLISVMHRGSIWRSWPIISLSTSSLSCCAVICSVACSKSLSLCFASRASWRCSRRGAVCRILPAVHSPHWGEQESCDFPGFTMQSERMLFFPYPFCTLRFFHQGPFSVGAENFAVGSETGNWARGERGKHLVTKFLQCLSEKQYSVKLFPTIKPPSALKLWALSWQSDGCCFMSVCEIKTHTPHMLSFILECYLRSSVQVSDWDQLPLRWESLIFLLSKNCFLKVTYIKKWQSYENMVYTIYSFTGCSCFYEHFRLLLCLLFSDWNKCNSSAIQSWSTATNTALKKWCLALHTGNSDDLKTT